MAIPRDKFTTADVMHPKGLVNACGPMWVWCEDGDPTKAVFYKGYSIQGNADKRVCDSLPKPYDGCELVYIETLFIPWKD